MNTHFITTYDLYLAIQNQRSHCQKYNRFHIAFSTSYWTKLFCDASPTSCSLNSSFISFPLALTRRDLLFSWTRSRKIDQPRRPRGPICRQTEPAPSSHRRFACGCSCNPICSVDTARVLPFSNIMQRIPSPFESFLLSRHLRYCERLHSAFERERFHEINVGYAHRGCSRKCLRRKCKQVRYSFLETLSIKFIDEHEIK